MKIIQWTDPRLRQAADPVTPDEVASDEFAMQVRELAATLVRYPAYAIAAPQVGWMRRVIVMIHPYKLAEIGAREDRAVGQWGLDLALLVNPEVVAIRGGVARRPEACLSFLGAGEELVPVREDVDVECPDVTELSSTGIENVHVGKVRYIALAARVVQHEIDHLNGRVMSDRMGRTQRQLFLQRLRKAQQKRARAA